MTDISPDADMVLKTPLDFATNDEIQRGYLKIFLGYCAGVGKTYRMLQEAIINKNNSVDVVIGIVETHNRKETEALIKELEIVPRKAISYAGISITEMDLDGILARKPQVVLVDELAHTNIPGLRHAKRYQDVEELLNAGINVYSTLNIQHIQSLVDIVHQIVNVKVEEVIPDRILELAKEIELVDLSPEKLQQRLLEGKVYIPQKAKQAMQKFFKKGNLLALRELSLKYTAKRVDIDLLSYREREEISNIWPVESKLLVSISSTKITEKLLLIAHRMAIDLEAEWYAVHVESPQQVRNTEKARNQLYKNIHLAEELGAKMVSLIGNDIADEIVKFAKQKNVTLIIAGLSQRSRFQELLKGSVLNNLVKKSSTINVLVVGDDSELINKKTQKRGNFRKPETKTYLLSFISIIFMTLICWLFRNSLSTTNFLLLFLLPSIASGILWNVRVGLFGSLFSIAIIDFLFTAPRFSFAVLDKKVLINFALFVLVTITISSLGRLIRWRAESARHRERFISALYNFSREMMIAENIDDILRRAVKNISEAFECDVIVLLPNKVDKLELVTKSKVDLILNDTELAVAMWAYKNRHPAGKNTSTLSSAKWYYLPLKINDRVLGVACLMKFDYIQNFSPEQKRLLESFASVVALSLAKVWSK
jgi:two-component system, OmpR family, sensor histidine kinase KdpD